MLKVSWIVVLFRIFSHTSMSEGMDISENILNNLHLCILFHLPTILF